MPSRRAQIVMSPEEIDAFLADAHTMNTATYNHDGTIHLVAMWFAMLDGDAVFWTFSRSQKIKNLGRDPRITALVEDGQKYEELRGVEIVGQGELVTDRDAIMEIGALIYPKYFGELNVESRPLMEAIGNKRYAVRIKADRVVSWDHRKLDGVY
jgi:PPOX class probable F420-dependent enzyme